MKFGTEEIQEAAAALGFRADSLEKVFRLLSLLETLRSNAFLRPRVALKGGTALNLFLFEVPRLSVDIDLNYVGSGDRRRRREAAELKRELVPMLRADMRPRDDEISRWATALVNETRALMEQVLPLEARELAFIDKLNGAGEIAPELLTNDPGLQGIIRGQPGLEWKALNVKKRLGGATDASESE